MIAAPGHTDGDADYICDACGTDLCVEHTVETLGAKAPTCTESGLTEGKKCATCGEVIVAQTVIPALGHTEGDAVKENEVAPDCVNQGSHDNVVYCTVCAEELSRETVMTDATGHSYTDYVSDGNATCTEDGTKTAVCDHGCGYTDTETDLGSATGHEWLDATTEAPKTCKHCGETEGEKLPEVEVEPDTDPTPDEPSDEKNHDECASEANAWQKLINAIINFFRSLLGLPEECICGEQL